MCRGVGGATPGSAQGTVYGTEIWVIVVTTAANEASKCLNLCAVSLVPGEGVFLSYKAVQQSPVSNSGHFHQEVSLYFLI